MHESRVLVTGATGLVGSAVVRLLLRRNCLVRVLARDPSRARALFGSRVEVVAGDLREPHGLRLACEGIADIYHVAAVIDTHDHGDVEFLDTNVGGTQSLLEAARATGIVRFVYTSSVSVYGDSLPLGIVEDAPFHPSGIYGRSKVQAEHAVQSAVRGGLRAMIIRPCIVYGPGDRHFIPHAVRVLRLPVVPLPDGGRHLVDVVHADDLAAAHVLVMEAGHAGDAYHVTDGGTHEAGDLLRWMADALHRSPWWPPVSRRAATVMRPWITLLGHVLAQPELTRLQPQELDGLFTDYHFDISKIRALAYEPRVDARLGLMRELRRCAESSAEFATDGPRPRRAPR